jgi:hypothetical protein
MTELSQIRDLECRLHSHFLEWNDSPLQSELLYLLDELQVIHGELDKRNIPNKNTDGIEMTLSQRIACLIQVPELRSQPILDDYGKPLRSEPQQFHLF